MILHIIKIKKLILHNPFKFQFNYLHKQEIFIRN